MNGTWFRRLRVIHTWLGVFFSPLLLLFVVTGWWQTFATDETKDHGPINAFFSRLSDIHTSDYFQHHAGEPHSSGHFKIYVSLMAATLILSIVLGLIIACQNPRQRPTVVLALVLGIALPALILYLN